MFLTDTKINDALEKEGYIRRESWQEKKACYRLDYDGSMEFGYMCGHTFREPKSEEDRWRIGYDDISADDWQVMVV